jgi:iron complex outermembrane receptor protein
VAVSVFGNPDIQSERFVSTEAGYRVEIRSRAAIDFVGFIGRYDRLTTREPGDPTFTLVDGQPVIAVSAMFQNLLEADTRGGEVAVRVTITDRWQADGTFSAFHLTPHPDPRSRDAESTRFDGDAPGFQWRGHSAFTLGPRTQADVLLFYVGELQQLGVPAYTRADVRLEWKATPRLSLMAQGQNLFQSAHGEFTGDVSTITSTQVPRSGSVRLTWRF